MIKVVPSGGYSWNPFRRMSQWLLCRQMNKWIVEQGYDKEIPRIIENKLLDVLIKGECYISKEDLK